MIEISKINHKDRILIDGEYHYVEKDYKGNLAIRDTSKYGYSYIKLEDLIYEIEDIKKYVPKISYQGATADIEAYIKDNGNLLYLECVGQEDMVKSITSVLMQGKVRMNDHPIHSKHIGYFSINKAGNKRKLISLADGIAHSILYHSPSISDIGFSLLIGRDDDELLKSFSSWLDKCQPLPYPRGLIKEIFEKLKNSGKLDEPTTYNIKAVKIDLSILENEFMELQEIILEVCRENNLIDENFVAVDDVVEVDIKPNKKVNYPYLMEHQVKKIFDTLKSMPKTYELDNVKIKPVGLKLFGPNFNIYVVEADKNPSMEQCFGYVENLSDPECSEWGYINIPYYLQVTAEVPFVNSNRKISVGFEQDLYFEDRFITENGEILTKEEYEGSRIVK